MKELYGKKLGMTQIFNEDGTVIPVTVIEAYKLVVVGKKTADKEGYNAIVVGFGDIKEQRANNKLIRPSSNYIEPEPMKFIQIHQR